MTGLICALLLFETSSLGDNLKYDNTARVEFSFRLLKKCIDSETKRLSDLSLSFQESIFRSIISRTLSHICEFIVDLDFSDKAVIFGGEF